MSDKHTKILLIEDNPGYVRLVQTMLAVPGQVEYQIECADRLSTGLEQLGKGEIDVVLLDLGLPDSQGLDTLNRVRVQAPAVPIVVMTGLDDETVAVQAMRQGAQDYLIKGEVDSKTLYRVTRYAVERKWAEEALRKSEEKYHSEQKEMQLQLVRVEKMSALGTMAAGVAHELLNPMMGMLNFAQYCLKHTTEDDSRYPVLQDIERETRRCVDIVSNLTTFSHMEKQSEEGYQEESLATIIERVVKLLSYRIEKEHVSSTQQVAEGTPRIWMKVNGMQQVLLNLISNALDAVMESRKKEIHVEVHREGDFVQLTVADSGCGLAPENLEKVYDPFFTTKPIGQGTGLGLTTSRSIIDSHGGNITCESELGVGTTFRILLPVETKGGAK